MRNGYFRRLFLASVGSLAGDWFSFVAVASLVTELTGRPGAPAFVYAATVLPVFLASPLAGTLGDRFGRSRGCGAWRRGGAAPRWRLRRSARWGWGRASRIRSRALRRRTWSPPRSS